MSVLKFSIVMPSYNQAHFLDEAIASVVEQDHPEVELIIMDGGSTDGTLAILERWRNHPRITRIISEKDKGQADALQRGFGLCTGEVFGWLNSDDVLEKNAIALAAEIFERQAADVVNGRLMVIDDQSAAIEEWPQRRIANRGWLHISQPIGQPSTFFRAALYRLVGGVDASYRFAMDYDLFFRFALANARFAFSDQFFARFRVHGQSKTMALPYKFWKEEIAVYRKHTGTRWFSGFYYWKFRGIVSYYVKNHLLKTRKF